MGLTFKSKNARNAFIGRLDLAKRILSSGCMKDNCQLFLFLLNWLEADTNRQQSSRCKQFLNAGLIRLVCHNFSL